MKETFPAPESLAAFKPEDRERLEEIKRLKEDLIKQGLLPAEAAADLGNLDVEAKAAAVEEALEASGQQRETIRQNLDKGEVRIGKERTPVFENSQEQLTWQLEGEQFREQGQTMVEVFFRRTDGIEVRPGAPSRDVEKTRFENRDRFMTLADYKALKKEQTKYAEAMANLTSTDTETKKAATEYLKAFKEKNSKSEWAARALTHLNGSAAERIEEVFETDPNFVETPHVVATLEQFTRLTNRQLQRREGLVILEGDAGTGKNKLIDHFSDLTHRTLFRFTCSAGKDEQDLKYLLEFDPKKGTYRIKSSVIEALETPGAILEFDEINTLPPEVAKSLNSLFDSDRAVFLGEDKKVVRAAEGVLLVGLQNPQHYAGVKPLAETIKSRARIMEVTYPPFEKGAGTPGDPLQYRSDEALILKQYVPEVQDMNKKDFGILWDFVVNSRRDPQVAGLLSVVRREGIEKILAIVTIANKIRTAYRAYHEGKSDDPVKFIFSLRESVEAAFELGDIEVSEEEKKQGITGPKKAIKTVILPKIPMGEERIHIEALINEL